MPGSQGKSERGDMKIMKLPLLIGLMTLAIALSSISCKKDTGRTGAAKMPPGHEKMVEERLKSLEESKKVVIAKVNGADISMFNLINEMNAIAPQYIKPGQKKDPQIDERVRKEALDRLIYRELAVQEALRQRMKVRPESMEDALKKVKANLKSEDAYREKLRQSGLSEEELKRQIERDLLIEMITEKEIFGKVTVDPGKVEKAYAREKASYKRASGEPMSFEEARPLIEQKLMTSAVHKREDEWTDQLRKAAKIEITLGESAKGIHSIK